VEHITTTVASESLTIHTRSEGSYSPVFRRTYWFQRPSNRQVCIHHALLKNKIRGAIHKGIVIPGGLCKNGNVKQRRNPVLKSGNTIRLNNADIDRISGLAGASPEGIHTKQGLNNFINFHLTQYSNKTPEEKLLALLLESEKIPG
jgi:hypothetical protein